ncbi:hypothetical protein RRG08_023954 [Elysia crispata]|uniref:Uncharacterized protein n=1 Tax=Elysia crispata TaxID=231223 RepID=A0AAE0YNX1_9GAST|nr:hypothetical protein RRG08_023954 [Elysia crispata]
MQTTNEYKKHRNRQITKVEQTTKDKTIRVTPWFSAAIWRKVSEVYA